MSYLPPQLLWQQQKMEQKLFSCLVPLPGPSQGLSAHTDIPTWMSRVRVLSRDPKAQG